MTTQTIKISQIAHDLADGERHRGVCPFCSGGSTGELSFTVRRDGHVAWYHCFRASCGRSGRYLYAAGDAASVAPKSQQQEDPRFRGGIFPLTDEAEAFLRERFYLTDWHFKRYPMYSTWDGRIILPVRDRYGRRIGEVLRYYKELCDTHYSVKAKLMVDYGEPSMAWYIDTHRAGQSLVVVEDQISAMRASKYMDAVALLGTNMSKQKMLEIAAQNYDRVIIALDSDAFNKAVTAYHKSKAIIRGVCVMRLSSDLKDMNEHELQEMLK